MSEKWRNLHRWQKFYTAAGSDGIDKFQLWLNHPLSSQCMFIMVMVSSSLVCLFWSVWITTIRKKR